jgi:hypothetical protein
MEQAEEEDSSSSSKKKRRKRKSVIDYIEEKCASPIPKRPRWMCGSLGLHVSLYLCRIVSMRFT